MKIIITEEEIKGTPNNYDLGKLVRSKYNNILDGGVSEDDGVCKCGKKCMKSKICSNENCCMKK